ncbi:MAG TPA: cation diffusion facilitator family transporter [Tepidisphaeraceae bacterium]|nr:cation diffusion facilitator family transporter [Tepidisphaeraceae bacterium]
MEQAQRAPAQPTFRAELWPVVLSLALGIVLLTVKFVAYYITKSAAIFSDAMENVVNVLTSAFAVYAVCVAHQPADQDHPYGHGKIEFLSAGFEGGMILLAAVLIAVRAMESLAIGQGPMDVQVGIILTFATSAFCAVVGLFLRRRAASTGSMTLEADGIHLLSDAVTGAIVLAGLLVVHWTKIAAADPIAALLVSAWIITQGAGLVKRSAAGLMDQQDARDTILLQAVLDRHCGLAGAEPRICSYHKVRHRHTGRHHWVDFHIQVPADWDVARGHRVATSIEIEIERELGDCNATAHVEPCIAPECQACAEKKP